MIMDMQIFERHKEKVSAFGAAKIVLFIVLAFSLLIFFSGCSRDISTSPEYITPKNTSASKITETEPSQVIGSIPKVTLNEELQRIIEAEIRLSAEAYAGMRDFISGTTITYEHDELFGIGTALEKYYAMTEYETKSGEFIQGGKINRKKLRDRILTNSEEYSQTSAGNMYKAFTVSEFDKIFGIFVDTLEFWLEQADVIGIDVEQLDDKLKDIKLLNSNSGFYQGHTDSENNILALNLDSIANSQNNSPDIDYIRSIAIHETNHFIQFESVLEREKEGYLHNGGIRYEWEDLAVNPLGWEWFTEGAAEKLKLEAYGEGAVVTNYEENVKAIEAIALAAILSEDVGTTTIEKLSFQSDLNKLFNIFECRTEEDKKEIVKMMYAFNIIYAESEDFFETYQSSAGSKMSYYDKSNYWDGLKASAAGTLTKIFYSNLSKKMSERQLKLEEVFTLVSVFETELNRITWYSTGSRLEANCDFFDNYISIQNEYFMLLSYEADIDSEKLYNAYNAYNASLKSGVIQLSFLSADKNRFLTDIAENRQNNKKNSINEVYKAMN